MVTSSEKKILRIDLSRGSITEDSIDEETYRLYPGGKALAGYLLLKELPAHTEPFTPENVLIFATGLLTGAPLATATRFTAAARSPLTGAYGESEAGGYWGTELKLAGFEAIVVNGRADSPVYLSILDGKVSIRDAKHLWGKDPEVVQNTIHEELNDEKVSVLQIGIAGENLVRFASITHNMRHYNGRNGMGAVMGSKNLRAIAVRSRGKRYKDFAFNSTALVNMGKRFANQYKENPLSWSLHEKGTMPLVEGLNAGGMLPTRNFRSGIFEGAEKIGWNAFEDEILIGKQSCHACSIRCKPEVEVDDRFRVSSEYGGPEYEAVAGFGSNCGIDDLQAVAKANELCNRYVMDTISTSATIAFVMDCFENDILTVKETSGLELRFGNADAMIEAVELIARRQGFGALLAEGSLRIAQKIGKGSLDFAIQVKGQELSMHDPRGKTNVGLGFAVSEIGADHLVSMHDSLLQNEDSIAFQNAKALGIRNAYPATEINDEKVEQYLICENWTSLGKVLGFCYFGPIPRSFIQVGDVIEAVRSATGWDVDLDELSLIGERATNLARMFNAREGFTRVDDTLPKRLFTPLDKGPLMGVAIEIDKFRDALTTLYQLKGWDSETGLPTVDRLERLGLSWTLDAIGEQKTVEIHLNGHLNFFDPEKRNRFHLPISEQTDLREILKIIHLPQAEIALISKNGEHIDVENTVVHPGDRIDFYPPMGGG